MKLYMKVKCAILSFSYKWVDQWRHQLSETGKNDKPRRQIYEQFLEIQWFANLDISDLISQIFFSVLHDVITITLCCHTFCIQKICFFFKSHTTHGWDQCIISLCTLLEHYNIQRDAILDKTVQVMRHGAFVTQTQNNQLMECDYKSNLFLFRK